MDRGVSPLAVVEAYIAAVVAMLIFAVPASIQQQRYSPIQKNASKGLKIDPARVFIVAAILAAALAANITANLKFPALLETIPVLGIAVWIVILLTAGLRAPDWKVMPETFKGTIFLLAFVTCLADAGRETACRLVADGTWPGFVSAVFDNIPLTALALKQGGYDWGYLAYAVGFGGSMIWFGSSAGVALSNMYPEAKSVGRWVSQGWPCRSLCGRIFRDARRPRLASRHAALGEKSTSLDFPEEPQLTTAPLVGRHPLISMAFVRGLWRLPHGRVLWRGSRFFRLRPV